MPRDEIMLWASVPPVRSSLWHDPVVDASRLAPFLNFADLPSEELDELAAAMSEVEVEAGTTILTVDHYGTAIYLVEQGNADVLNGGDETTNALGPGDTFGEIGLLLTGERTATVVARTPMRLLSLSGEDFDRIRERVPEVERSLRRLGIERAGR
jgi:CRP-like cAMP-binding protein